MPVDVVTAVHAAYARFLPLTWASLRAQSYPDWTWVVQVDGPATAVRAALSDCGAASDPRVQVDAHDEQLGPANTRNIAVGRSSAPLIQNLDADDELEPDALEVLVGALRLHAPAGFAVGHARDLLADGSLVDFPLPVSPGLVPAGGLLESWLANPERAPVHPAGVLWRRSPLVRSGGWSALHGREDTGLLLAVSAVSAGVVVDAPTLRYRKHPGQQSELTAKFRGGGAQIALIRQRAERLAEMDTVRYRS